MVLNHHDVWELYDLSADPDELHNLAGDPEHGAVTQRLHEQLMVCLEREGVPDPTEPRMTLTRTEDVGLDPFATRDE